MTNILLCGVGGQGIVLTSKLIAAAAAAENMKVMSAETIGMAQKGGSVTSFLRTAAEDEDLFSPMFPKHSADIIIAFEPSEAVRNIGYLKEGGTVVVNTHGVMPVTAALSGGTYDPGEMLSFLEKNVQELISLDADRICKEIGSPKVLNMIMLAAAVKSGAVKGIDMGIIADVMKKTVKPQFHELNMRALSYEP
ncbi:MAG: indolepyruvate oxidoreductase subunit beta [Oscillospiraceae bacterium]|nr:indolepyruvate oxidoreductase subunit beta [Oscillospiraceae bacterium]